MSDPLSVSPDGGTVVCGDGPELLVYDGNGAPRFKHFLEDVIVAVAAAPDRVWALLGDGRIQSWKLHDAPLDPEETPGGRALAVAPDGLVAAATRRGVALFDPAGPRRGLAVGEVLDLAFGADRSTLGILTGSALAAPRPADPKAPAPPPPPPGSAGFAVIDANSGATLGSMPLSGAPGGVARVGTAAWVVSHGHALSVFSRDAGQLLHSWTEQEPFGAVAGTPDGVACAAVVGRSTIAVYETHTYKCAGKINISRPISRIAFEPGGRLVIGHDDADLTFVDLFTATVTRSEPHPGRGRNNWGVKHELDAGTVRGALVKAKAGRVAVARYVGPIDDPDYDRRWWQSCALAAAIVFGLMFVCSGVSFVGWLLYIKEMLPWQ